MARAVKTMTKRATMKARAMRARATRVMAETSAREEGGDGHNNQLGTKATAMAKTVVRMTARATTTEARATATQSKRVTARTAAMMSNGDKDNKDQATTMMTMTTRGVGIVDPTYAIAAGDIVVPGTPSSCQWPHRNDAFVIIQFFYIGLTLHGNT
jgi:hypothetical protein